MYVSKICIKHKHSTSGIFGITLGSDVGLAGGGLQRECLDGHIIIGATKKVDFLPLRSSSCGVGPCATDRCRGDRALFLPTTGLQLQYDMPTLPASLPATSTLLTFYNTAECTSYVLAAAMPPTSLPIVPLLHFLSLPGTKVVRYLIYLTSQSFAVKKVNRQLSIIHYYKH